MSAYAFVPSAVDLGRARGPRRAFVVHMAEGGNTVGYLSRPNPNGVSVHFVVKRTGSVVRMLDLDRMHSSIKSSAIRTTDDADGFYGVTAARAVMGEWADVRRSLGPNHASIAVEVEGFAREGPSATQSFALARLYEDLRTRFPGIRALGHRDFASYKQCPGRLIRWQDLGGHGATGATGASADTSTEEDQDVRVVVVREREWPAPRRFTAPGPLRRFSATEEIEPPIGAGYAGWADASVSIESSGVPHGAGFLRLSSGGSAGKYVLAAQVALEGD
jgi:hypothetical protein